MLTFLILRFGGEREDTGLGNTHSSIVQVSQIMRRPMIQRVGNTITEGILALSISKWKETN